MKGSAITGPVGKEAAELWPVSRIDICKQAFQLIGFLAYREQLRRGDVRCFFSGSSTFMGSRNGEMHSWGDGFGHSHCTQLAM